MENDDAIRVLGSAVEDLSLEMGWNDDENPNRAEMLEALACIRAALADREHLEEGASIAASYLAFERLDGKPIGQQDAKWLESEHTRLATKEKPRGE